MAKVAEKTKAEVVEEAPKKKNAKKFVPIQVEGKQEAYCTKCRETQRMKKGSAVIDQTANLRFRLHGVCKVCGTNIGKFVKDPTAAAA